MNKKPKLTAKPVTPVTHIGTQIQVSFVKPSADGSSGIQRSVGSFIQELTREEWNKAYEQIQASLARASAMTLDELIEETKPKQ